MLAILDLQCFHFFQTPAMTRLVRKRSSQKSAGQFFGKLDADDARTENENIHIVMLDALMRGVCVMCKAGANAGEFVRGYGSSHAAATNQNAAIDARLANGEANCFGVVGIIHWIGAIRSEIGDVMSQCLEKRN